MAATNFLLFRYAGRTLALNADLARQVQPVEQVFAIPGVSGVLLGLIPVAGRSLPLIDLAGLGGLDAAPGELALMCEIADEQFALPVEQVIGFVSEDDAPQSTDLLTEETLLGGYSGGGHKGQVINPHALLAALQDRLLPL